MPKENRKGLITTGVIPTTQKVHKKKLNIRNFLIIILIILIIIAGIYLYLKMPLKRIIITGNNNINNIDNNCWYVLIFKNAT